MRPNKMRWSGVEELRVDRMVLITSWVDAYRGLVMCVCRKICEIW